MSEFIYSLYLIFAILALFISWKKNKTILHPHFLLTTIFVILISDFLVRGYDDDSIALIQKIDLYFYQIIILFILVCILYITSRINSEELEYIIHKRDYIQIPSKVKLYVLLGSLVVFSIEIYKRLYLVEWSINQLYLESLKPRGSSIWDESANIYGNAFYALAGILFPYAAMAITPLIYEPLSSLKLKIIPVIIFLLTVFFLVLGGSRTPVVMCFATLCYYITVKQKKIISKIITTSIIAVIIAILASLMVSNRSSGYEYVNSIDQEVIYSQDDSYYRALYDYDIASKTPYRWSPIFFFYTISVNYIPKSIWPNKPTFTEEFYGEYKEVYITTSFLGESVAMFGLYGSIFFSIFIGYILYLIFYNSIRILKYPMGLVSYFLVIIYIYMCIRSLPNLTFFIYLPGFSILVSYLLSKTTKNTSI